MRMWDEDSELQLRKVFVALTAEEAGRLVDEIRQLLIDPERVDHKHVYEVSGERLLSFMLATPTKIANSESQILKGEWHW